ncbi:MAG TPA: 6-bladed beta-propeller, partial [Candidatus Lokiarchaeia archaeon]|nr:6-bladed beta-propeller [Candidatus Lokiarchaeia archaeon]
NVYAVDTFRSFVIETDAAGNYLTKWGGVGTSHGEFMAPYGIAIDGSGNVYVVDDYDFGSYNVQEFTASGTFITQWSTWSGGDGQFSKPKGIAVNSTGYVFVADSGHNGTQVFTASGQWVAKIGTTGTGNGQFNTPIGVAINNSNYLFVTDSGNNRIQVFDPNGNYLTQWAAPNSPQGICVNFTNGVYVTDNNFHVQVFNNTGASVTSWGGVGTSDGLFYMPIGVTTNSTGAVFVTDQLNNRIQVFNPMGSFLNKWGAGLDGHFAGSQSFPMGIAVNKTGYIYVADPANNRVDIFSPTGQFVQKFGGMSVFSYPCGIALNLTGNVYVTDYAGDRVQVFNQTGQLITAWGGTVGANPGQFHYPVGIAINSNSDAYIADLLNYRVQAFSSSGAYERMWGTQELGTMPPFSDGTFKTPYRLAIDGNDNVYVADATLERIQVFASTGTFLSQWASTSYPLQFFFPMAIAVNGTSRAYITDGAPILPQYTRVLVYSLDGSFITQFGSQGLQDGQFMDPQGIAVDGNGKVFVADDYRVQVFQETLVIPPPSFAPPAPNLASLTVDTAAPGNVTVKWDAATGAVSYSVYRYTSFISAVNNSITNVANPTTTTYTDQLTASGTYYYVVTATNASGTSGISNCKSVEVTFGGIPGPSVGWIALMTVVGIPIVIKRRKLSQK